MKLCKTHYNKFIINETRNLEYNETCSHPKHDEYKSQSKSSNKKSKKLNLEKVPKRLILVLQLDENNKICSMCRKRTDKDPDYNTTENYNKPISKKKDDNNIMQIGTHTYVLRNDIFYNQTEFKQLESDYQEIISQITISHEASLSEKIKKMSNILYKNQHQLNQKPIYDPIEFKNMLETADADLIGFFDELYKGTNPDTKNERTNNGNKKN